MSRNSIQNRWWWNMHLEKKLSRKAKKFTLGLKMNKLKLKKRIQEVSIKIDVWDNGYKVPYPDDSFCPYCGFEQSYSSGNRAEYPEVWETHYCCRCGEEVAEADNSALIHVLVDIKEEEAFKRGESVLI